MENITQLLKNAQKALINNDFNSATYYLEKVVAIDPKHMDANLILARLAMDKGDKHKALSYFKKVDIDICNETEIYYDYGRLLQSLNRHADALVQYEKAYKLSPDEIPLLANYGTVLNINGKNKKAQEIAEHMIELNHNDFNGYTLLGNILRDMGKIDEAIKSYRKALKINPEFLVARSNLLMCMNYLNYDDEIIFDEHKKWYDIYSKTKPQEQTNFKKDFKNDKIKIGYVSPDFRTHSVSYFIEAVLRNHDKSKFEIFCYSDVANPDPVTLRFMKMASYWRDISQIKNPTEVSNIIKKDNIDILVDLAGHAGNTRLGVFIQKPAPIQVTYLGYPNTTGIPEIDYRLTDINADPKDQDMFYTEKLFRMPNGFLCYTPPINSPLTKETPAIKNKNITFGSFNKYSKISDETITLWTQILKAVPNSNLLLKTKAFIEPSVIDSCKKRFELAGINKNRITCMEPSPTTEEHLDMYNSIDIALDTFPYNGTTTTCEALWMGTPVISFVGKNHRSRVGCSILSQLKLSDFYSEDYEKLINLAVFFSNNIEQLDKLGKSLRALMAYSPLCNSRSFTIDIENAYLNMLKNQ